METMPDDQDGFHSDPEIPGGRLNRQAVETGLSPYRDELRQLLSELAPS